jgi:hypothetical protein
MAHSHRSPSGTGNLPVAFVRRKRRLWHGRHARGLAVFRQHRLYSTDTSKSAALFVVGEQESLTRLLVSMEYHRSVPSTAPHGRAAHATFEDYRTSRPGSPCHISLPQIGLPHMPKRHRMPCTPLAATKSELLVISEVRLLAIYVIPL